jgi:serine/threonine-protein kinase
VPFSLTAELATAAPLGSDMLPPPVSTAELPALAAPTIQVPVVGGSATQEEVPKVTQEVPMSSTPTLEVPRMDSGPTEMLSAASIEQRLFSKAMEDARPLDATQPLDSATLAAMMGRSPKPAPAPAPKPRPAPAPAAPPARAEPRSEAQAAPAKVRPPSAPVAPASRSRSSTVALVLLTLAGLGLGAAGGYWLLWKIRHGARQAPAAPSSSQGEPR